jgi:hypothetical protein
MLVEELMTHFDRLPETIVYFDPRENVQDMVNVYSTTEPDKYPNFIAKYGDRRLDYWILRADGVLDLTLR